MNIIDEIVQEETLDSIRKLFEYGYELEKLKAVLLLFSVCRMYVKCM